MTKKLAIVLALSCLLKQGGAQQNWAPIPCFNPNWQIHTVYLDSLHNELILSFANTSNICNVNFKGLLAYNGSNFHALDYGLNTHNPNLTTGATLANCSVPYNGKTLFGGFFTTVGSNTLPAVSLALWNGASWQAFPKPTFNNTGTSNLNSVFGFLRDNNKLWIYGWFDNLGGVPGSNLYTFDGTNYTAVNLPVNDNTYITKLIKYKNEIYATGLFSNLPSPNFYRLAKFNGANWSSVGSGVRGNLGGVGDMLVYKDTLYIAGAFSIGDGNIGNYVMKWDGTQLLDAGFDDFFYDWGYISQLLEYKNRLYAFGNFTHVGDKKVNSSMAYYENGKWVASPDSQCCGINKAVVYKNELYIAGGFDAINGDTTLRYFAKLRCPDFDYVCTTGLNEHTKFKNLKIYPNPITNKLNINFEGIAPENCKLELLNCLGEVILTKQHVEVENETDSYQIDLSDLAKGIYFLRVWDAEAQQVFKVIKE
jgi:hypothetical protein